MQLISDIVRAGELPDVKCDTYKKIINMLGNANFIWVKWKSQAIYFEYQEELSVKRQGPSRQT